MEKYQAFTLDTSGEKVLYLTFDCGYEYENLTFRVLDTLKEKGVTATFFCTLDHIKKEPELISRMIRQGYIVGNHSTTHPSFATITREKMAKEIEETENYLRENFGYSAKYFRFPAGEYNESALELVGSLGYRSVFWSVAYDDWDTTKVRGKDYTIDKVMSRLHPGAVILLHSVSKDNAEALGDIIDMARAQGYRFESLENYR
jgi:peptidoglycan-N-acetylmuramic acid deacetylase